jgi:hypothetical protein
MKQTKILFRSAALGTALVLALAAITAAPVLGKAKKQVIEKYRFNALGRGHHGFAAGKATRLDLLVYRWTTPEEREEIISTLGGDDGDEIVRYLEGLEIVARLRIPGQQGVDLRYAWTVEQDGKTYVIGVSERSLLSRPMATTGDAPFYLAVLQLQFPEEGKGGGILAPSIYPVFQPDGRVEIKATVSDPITLTEAVKLKSK